MLNNIQIMSFGKKSIRRIKKFCRSQFERIKNLYIQKNHGNVNISSIIISLAYKILEISHILCYISLDSLSEPTIINESS